MFLEDRGGGEGGGENTTDSKLEGCGDKDKCKLASLLWFSNVGLSEGNAVGHVIGKCTVSKFVPGT